MARFIRYAFLSLGLLISLVPTPSRAETTFKPVPTQAERLQSRNKRTVSTIAKKKLAPPSAGKTVKKEQTAAILVTLAATDDWKTSWKIKEIEGTKESYKNVTVMKETGKIGSFFRVQFPKGSGPRGLWKSSNKPLGGVALWADGGFDPQKEVYLRYDVRIPEDFDFGKGGYLPGMLTGTRNGRTQESGAVVSLKWDKGGKLSVVGAFSPAVANWQGLGGDGRILKRDSQWHPITIHATLNSTPGKSDGFMEVLYDGVLIAQTKASFPSRTGDLWDSLLLDAAVGDDLDVFSVSPKDQYLDLANFTFSNKPIK